MLRMTTEERMSRDSHFIGETLAYIQALKNGHIEKDRFFEKINEAIEKAGWDKQTKEFLIIK